MNPFYFLAGLGFLGLARTKAALRGYSSPKPFSGADHLRCIPYDLGVVDGWLSALDRYVGRPDSLRGKAVLELGPESDLGTGVCLLAKGAARYTAFDVNALATHTSPRFYELLITRLCRQDPAVDGDELARSLKLAERFRYICRPDCNLSAALDPQSVDVVFSQAALEHFVDVDATFGQLSLIVRPGAVLVAEIDLTTHSRWIRDKDPLNIYRYSDRVYRRLSFSGAPNRLRPGDYREALARHGWEVISITSKRVLDSAAIRPVRAGLAHRFQETGCEMESLSIVVCATRADT